MEYNVRFTVGNFNFKRNGYGEFSISAVSEEEAVNASNAKLFDLDVRLSTKLVLQQEIKLPDGWHYFDANKFGTHARQSPALEPAQPGETEYRID
ncbi:MAG: hypothetical protein HY513_00180 [Candidatus Aenigmarchaeota archaeon]|nr:hypothetical protein [Candidatus Aenigmarchaeota archaeon]